MTDREVQLHPRVLVGFGGWGDNLSCSRSQAALVALKSQSPRCTGVTMSPGCDGVTISPGCDGVTILAGLWSQTVLVIPGCQWLH